ncbi:MAG: M16 family metallopeptidase [Thermoguttaceae bacterium]
MTHFNHSWRTLVASTFAVAMCFATPATSAETTSGERPLTITQQQSLPHNTTRVELSNGLTILVAEDHSAPVASVRAFVKNTGSAFEGQWLGSGISHLLEHIVAGGTTTKHSEKEIEHIIERIGGVTNAYTSHDMTCYFIDSTAASVMTTIALVADMMQHVTMEQTEFDREHKVVTQELLDGENDRGRVMWHLMSQAAYRESTIRHPIIGYIDNLKRLTRDDALAFYRERYAPNNITFVVAGDVDTAAVVEEIRKQFEGTPRGTEVFIPLASEPVQLAPRETAREMDGRTIQFAITYPTIKLDDADLFALDVIAYILSEGESSRLVRKLVYEQQLLLSVGVHSQTPHYVTGLFILMGVASPDKYEEAMQAILAEVERLKTEPVAADELDKAKRQKEAELFFGRQHASDVAAAMGRNTIMTGDPNYDDQYVAGIRSVTAADIERVARKFFDSQRETRIVIAPTGGLPKPAAAVADTSRAPAVMKVLPNGLRVVYKRQSNLPLVSVRAIVYGGMTTETRETAGRASLLAAMLDKGTERFTANEIADFFDSCGGTLSISSGRYSTYGQAIVLKQDASKAADILASCFFESTFPEQEFDQVKTLALGAIARRLDNPISELLEFFTESLPAGSIYSILDGGTTESVSPLKASDLKTVFAGEFVPRNMVVTVFGDIDEASAMAMVEKYFGRGANAPPHQIKPEELPAAPLEAGRRNKVTEKDAGMVLVAYKAPGIYSTQEHAAMRVLSAILSDGTGPNGWLFQELRGEGLVYRVNTSLRTGRVPGYMLVLAQTNPAAINEVVSRIEANIRRAAAGEIPQDDFDRACDRLVFQHAQQNVTIGEQSQQVSTDVLFGLGLDYDRTFPERIRAVTLKDVVAVAQKYLHAPLVITTSPEK